MSTIVVTKMNVAYLILHLRKSKKSQMMPTRGQVFKLSMLDRKECSKVIHRTCSRTCHRPCNQTCHLKQCSQPCLKRCRQPCLKQWHQTAEMRTMQHLVVCSEIRPHLIMASNNLPQEVVTDRCRTSMVSQAMANLSWTWHLSSSNKLTRLRCSISIKCNRCSRCNNNSRKRNEWITSENPISRSIHQSKEAHYITT